MGLISNRIYRKFTKVGTNDAITTWVDRLTRRVHFLSCTTNETAEDTANAFF